MSAKLACWRFFFVLSTSARASHAPIPSVLPRRRTSSTSALSLRALRWGSISAAVSSFRLLPSSEKILEDAIVIPERVGRFGGGIKCLAVYCLAVAEECQHRNPKI